MKILFYLLFNLASVFNLKNSILSTILSKRDYFEIGIDSKVTLYIVNLDVRYVEVIGYDDGDYFYYEKFLLPDTCIHTDIDYIYKVLQHTSTTIIHGNIGYILINDKVNESLFAKSLKENVILKNESLKALHDAVQEYDKKDEFVPDYIAISKNTRQLNYILRYKEKRVKMFKTEYDKISLYVIINKKMRMYVIDHTDIKIDDELKISILNNVTTESYSKRYLIKYLDIPLLKHLSNTGSILSNEEEFYIEKDGERENLLIYRRHQYDLIVDNKTSLYDNKNSLDDDKNILEDDNIANYVYVYLKGRVININGYEISSDLDETNRLLISEDEFKMFKSSCIRFNDEKVNEVEYIVYILKDTDILDKAIDNIMKSYTPSLYILFIHSLHMCGIIDKKELIKLLNKENIKDDVIEKIKKNDEIFTNNYAKLLRFILYIEINELFKEFLSGKSHDFKSEYFKDTKEFLSKENVKYNISNIDLSGIFIKSAQDLQEILKNYDNLIDKVIPDILNEVEISLLKK